MEEIRFVINDSTVRLLEGDALTVLKNLPDESVNVCVTSPPYYNLRDYGSEGQIGHEPSPEEYIAKLVEVFREVKRVLKKDGTLWVNIGDSYAANSGNQPPTNTRNSCGHTAKRVPEGYKPKDLIGIPWMLAFALRADGWYLRQDIIWEKANGLPENVRDRCTRCHEYIFLLSKSKKYYFDTDANSEPATGQTTMRYLEKLKRAGKTDDLPKWGGDKYGDDASEETRTKSGKRYVPKERRNKRDVWTMATAHYNGAHAAVFPKALAENCILAGSREGDVVLDPFSGSGTSGVVAVRNNRNYIGIDVNHEYIEMQKERIQKEGGEEHVLLR